MPQNRQRTTEETDPLVVERRRAPRSPAGIIGSIRLFGSDPEKCLIEDVSVDGARILRYFSGQLPRFLNLEIAPGMTVPASVIWEDEDRIGVKFAHTVGTGKTGLIRNDT